MACEAKKFRFLFIPAFRLPGHSRFSHVRTDLPKEQRLMNFEEIKHLLDDVEWDLHEGALASYGDWAVENREEFCLAAAARLPLVREACETGKYNAIIPFRRRRARFPGVSGDCPKIQHSCNVVRLFSDAYGLHVGKQIQRDRFGRIAQHVLLRPCRSIPFHEQVRIHQEYQLSHQDPAS